MTPRSVLGAAIAAAFVLASAVPAVAQPATELHHCVPADLREDSITFKAEDGVELSGLVFGSGSSGVLLAHDMTEVTCAWLPLAQQLADDGYQVLLHEARSLTLREGKYRYDLDVLAAAKELGSRGASSIVAGGGGIGATAIASIAGKIPDLKGMFLLTPFEIFSPRDVELDALAGIGAAQAPAFVTAAQDDVIELKSDGEEDIRLADHARTVSDAASNGRLEIVQGKARGATLLEDTALRDKVRAFVRETMPPPTFLDRWLIPIGGGVVLLVLVVVGVVVLRKRAARNTTTAPDVSADS